MTAKRTNMGSVLPSKHRKVEVRVFLEIWTEKYFFIELNDKPTCLICQARVSDYKDYNMKRHYDSRHNNYNDYSGQCRLDKIAKLKSTLMALSSFFANKVTETEKIVQASYAICEHLAKQMKPFTDGELIKQCMLIGAQYTCPEQRSTFSKISLSRTTVADHISELAADIKEQSKECSEHFDYFSIAVDESTDASNTAQLAIFVRGINSDLVISERFIQLIPLKGTTTGQDIFNAVLVCLKGNNLDLSKLVSVTTDGAPAMVGSRKGFVSLLEKHIISEGYGDKLIKLHCIIHQEALCAVTLHMEEVMKVAVKIVNYIKSNALNHRQFKEFLLEEDASYSDLAYYCDVRWLSRGKMLERFYGLLTEFIKFLELKNQMAKFPELKDPEWVSKLAFLVDMTSELNQLNLKLQGPNQLVTDLIKHVDFFDLKLEMIEGNIREANFTKLPMLKNNPPSDTSELLVYMANLRLQFSTRFADIRAYANELLLFSNPVLVNWREEVHSDFQLELMELQTDPDMKIIFERTKLKKVEDRLPLMDFYQKYVHEARSYPKLIAHAKKMACIFGSTYVCEQLFSKMKFTKNKYRTRLTDSHLNDILCISSSSMTANIEKLVKKKQHQVSH